jgi:hypothetical protein
MDALRALGIEDAQPPKPAINDTGASWHLRRPPGGLEVKRKRYSSGKIGIITEMAK